MSVTIRSEDGSVTIKADDGSSVRNVRINGNRVDVGPPRRHFRSLIILACFALVWGLAYCYLRVLTKRYPLDCGPWDGVHADAYRLCMAKARQDRSYCDRIADPTYQDLCYRSVRP